MRKVLETGCSSRSVTSQECKVSHGVPKRRGAKGGGMAPSFQKGKKVESVSLSLLLISNFLKSLLNRSS